MSRRTDQYHSVPLRAKAQTTGSYYTDSPQTPKAQSHISRSAMPTRQTEDHLPTTPKSVLRWTDEQGNQVVQQGKQRLVIHQGKPPRSLKGVWYVGIGALVTIALVIGGQAAIGSIQAHNVDSVYGYPRTYQTDAVVGHQDSPAHPSHFTFENLHGQVLIIELPGGTIAHAHIYSAGAVLSPSADQVPVTGHFADTNGDGRPDMLVTIGSGDTASTITFLNNGTQFVAPR
jgi:hypothetical protein